MGFGDVRLAGVIGAASAGSGWRHSTSGFLAASCVGAVIGHGQDAGPGHRAQDQVPFAPALAVGAVVGVLWGSWLANYWVLHT